MLTIHATSRTDLLAKLREIDISCPPRNKCTPGQVEVWSGCRLLATIARDEALSYPLALTHRDRPDFFLVLPSRVVGIEITEAVPSNWAWALSKRDENDPEKPIMLERFAPGEAPRPRQEIEHIARGGGRGGIWPGDASEEDWAAAMLHFSIEKKRKVAKPGFVSCDENWLVIYDSWNAPGLDETKAAQRFFQRLLTVREPLRFQRIFVERKKTFWQFTDGGFWRSPINDLWTKDC